MEMKHRIAVASLAVTLIAWSAAVQTASATIVQIVKPTSVNVTTPATGSPNWYAGNPNNMINGSGLSASYSTGDIVPGTWATHSINIQSDLWVSNNYAQGWDINFTLGSLPAPEFELTGFHLWNETETYGRNAQGYTVQVSYDNGGNWYALTASPNPLIPATYSSYTGADYTFGSRPFNPTNIRFHLNQATGTDGYIGISEIRFFGAVPEPSTLLLIFCGAATAWWFRRRAEKV